MMLVMSRINSCFSCNIPKQTNLPKSRVNPNLATKEEPWRPVLLAADRGHHGVLHVLATHTEKGVGVSEKELYVMFLGAGNHKLGGVEQRH